MSVILFPVDFIATLVAILFTYNWVGTPAFLGMNGIAEWTIEPQLSKNKSREVIAFVKDGQPYNIACGRAPPLCKELARRPMKELRVWVNAPGFRAGDWFLGAKEGEKTWVLLDEQRQRFARMNEFYDAYLLVSGLLALGLVYLLYGRSRKSKHA